MGVSARIDPAADCAGESCSASRAQTRRGRRSRGSGVAPKPPTAVRVLAEVAADDLGVVLMTGSSRVGTTTVGSDIAASPVPRCDQKQRWCDGRGNRSHLPLRAHVRPCQPRAERLRPTATTSTPVHVRRLGKPASFPVPGEGDRARPDASAHRYRRLPRAAATTTPAKALECNAVACSAADDHQQAVLWRAPLAVTNCAPLGDLVNCEDGSTRVHRP